MGGEDRGTAGPEKDRGARGKDGGTPAHEGLTPFRWRVRTGSELGLLTNFRDSFTVMNASFCVNFIGCLAVRSCIRGRSGAC